MKQKITIDDYIFYYYFEKLLPEKIYSGNILEQRCTLNELRYGREDYINSSFNSFYQKANLSVSDTEYKFHVNIMEREDIHVLKITFPPQKADIDSILRAYLLFYEYNDKIFIEKYFLIKRLPTGEKYIIYVTPQMELYIMGQLHAQNDDMESEYQELIIYFHEIISTDIKAYEKTENHSDQKDTEKWSKDWKHFDWNKITDNINKMAKELKESGKKPNILDVGITQEEFFEYFEWLSSNNPIQYFKELLYLTLRNAGASHDKGVISSDNSEILKQLCEILKEN